jgi:hypothetical protein
MIDEREPSNGSRARFSQSPNRSSAVLKAAAGLTSPVMITAELLGT